MKGRRPVAKLDLPPIPVRSRRFQYPDGPGEPGIIDQTPERCQPECAFAKGFVPVHPGTEGAFAVVEVEAGDPMLSWAGRG
jgi:hypothetical protein